MLLLIDNYDSFTYNLYQYLCELGAEVEVVRNDKIGVEDVGEQPYRIDRMWTHLRLAGVFDRVLGLALGDFIDCETLGAEFTLQEILWSLVAETGLPCVGALPIGHGAVNVPVALGTRVRLDGGAGTLFFLEPALADATIAQNDQSQLLETFVTNPSADEVEVLVQNVSLSELSSQPFKAAVTFQKVYYTPGTRSERNRETYVAQIDFVMRDHVPNEFVRVNPLGLQISYFRVDQAFEDSRR